MMLLQTVEMQDAIPRWLINGFPKSGLHLVKLMIEPLADPVANAWWSEMDWWGVLEDVWSVKWRDESKMARQWWKLSHLEHGHYLKGHVPFRENIAEFISKLGLVHLFVYRDLRDVAVSQAYHVLSDDDVNFRHSGKAMYRLMDGFDEVLLAVIEGIGPYAGIVERWEMYEPWLRDERVLCLKFENVLADRQMTAQRILSYGLNKIVTIWPTLQFELHAQRYADSISKMVETSKLTHMASTFRKGTAGQWREHFKPQHVEAFKRLGGETHIERLGYGPTED